MSDGSSEAEGVERNEKYRKVPEYEQLLSDFNRRIAELEPPRRDAPRGPVTFIVGVPRSGTTLLYQTLASTGAFGYVSNVVARFFRAPWVGARIQRILAPVLERSSFTYESSAGLTEPWYEPHEFGYFWERHFDFEDHHELPEGFGSSERGDSFRGELGALEQELGGPLLFKNVILDFAVDVLDRWLDGARFVHMKRDPMLVAQSLYRTRIDYYGTPEAWFSVEPADAPDPEETSPARQIAHQMARVLDELEGYSSRLGGEQWTEVEYGTLCERPTEEVSRIAEWLGLGELDLEEVPESFPPSDTLELDPEILDELERELNRRGVST